MPFASSANKTMMAFLLSFLNLITNLNFNRHNIIMGRTKTPKDELTKGIWIQAVLAKSGVKIPGLSADVRFFLLDCTS